MRTLKKLIFAAVATFAFWIAATGLGTLFVNQAMSEPPDHAGTEDPVRPYQERNIGNFNGASSTTLPFSNPTVEGEVLVVEFVSATLTTDPDAIQAVVDVQVVDVGTGITVINHRLVLAEQPPTGPGGSEAWEANQPVLIFVGNDQDLDIVCVTNPAPVHAAEGCRATIAGFIRVLAN